MLNACAPFNVRVSRSPILPHWGMTVQWTSLEAHKHRTRAFIQCQSWSHRAKLCRFSKLSFEASRKYVIWPRLVWTLTNQKPVFRSGDLCWPMRCLTLGVELTSFAGAGRRLLRSVEISQFFSVKLCTTSINVKIWGEWLSSIIHTHWVINRILTSITYYC